MSDAAFVKHTRSFKKYTAEYREDLVEAARTAAALETLEMYEDASIVKITGSKEDIDKMCADLREKFGPLPGDPKPKAKK